VGAVSPEIEDYGEDIEAGVNESGVTIRIGGNGLDEEAVNEEEVLEMLESSEQLCKLSRHVNRVSNYHILKMKAFRKLVEQIFLSLLEVAEKA
jgi:hypothetical protein